VQARGLKGEGVVRLSWTSFIGILLIDRTETTRDVSSARDGFAFAFAVGWFLLFTSHCAFFSFPYSYVLGTVFWAGRLCFVRLLRLELLTAHAHARHDFGPRPLRSDAGSTSCAQVHKQVAGLQGCTLRQAGGSVASAYACGCLCPSRLRVAVRPASLAPPVVLVTPETPRAHPPAHPPPDD